MDAPSSVTIAESIGTLAMNVGAAIGVLAYMLFRDWKDGKFKREEKCDVAAASNDPVKQALEQLSAAMSKLQNHFNEETTAILSDLQSQMKAMGDRLLRVDDTIMTIKARQAEIIKYGVPMRRTSIDENGI